MKVLVTGGAGFIGRRVVAALDRDGHDVTVLDTASEVPIDARDYFRHMTPATTPSSTALPWWVGGG